MKKLTHLGCLLALVFAGASAFADSWFANVVTENSGNGWSVPTGRWVWHTTYGTLNDWDVGAVYTVPVTETKKEDLSFYDSKITTTVKFTAMDAEDLQTYDISSAKAGVTVVEVVNGNATTYAFKVIKNGEWVDAGVSVESLDEPITVTVKFDKADTASLVSYVIGGTTVIGGTADGTITSVEYKGQCDLYNDLAGLAWNNVPGGSSKVVVQNAPAGCPSTIKYDHSKLKGRTGVDTSSDEAIAAYFTTKQGNGQFGWVNYALGQADNAAIAIKSNELSAVEGQLAVDFGFDIDTENYDVTYTVDGVSSDVPAVDVETGIHEISVNVATKGKTTPEASAIATGEIGVMITGKNTKGLTEPTFDIVAVPWKSFDGKDVTVDSLFVTSELNTGDELYILKSLSEGVANYDIFVFNKGTGWAPADNYAKANVNTPASEYKLKKGTALWLKHSVDSAIVFAGAAGTLTEQSTAIAVAGEWTLVANPSINDVLLTDMVEKPTVDDKIVLEDAEAPVECKYTDKGWAVLTETTEKINVPGLGEREIVKQEWIADSNYKIPAGIGFWYVNVGKDDTTITFPDNTPTTITK